MADHNVETIEHRHKYDVQVRFNDIDMFGHINNTVYLEFFDLAKLRYFEAVFGTELWHTGLMLVVVNINCDFHHPAFVDSRLYVATAVEHIGDKSLRLRQQVIDRDSGQVKCAATTIMATFDPKTQKSVVIAHDIRQKFADYENASS